MLCALCSVCVCVEMEYEYGLSFNLFFKEKWERRTTSALYAMKDNNRNKHQAKLYIQDAWWREREGRGGGREQKSDGKRAREVEQERDGGGGIERETSREINIQ